MKSLIKIFENRFRESWDKPALTDYGTDRTFTYGDIATRISYMHLLFEQVGIKPGDKVALCDKNCANWAVSMLAILTYKAVAVPLLTDYSNAQLVMLCEHCGAKFMIGNNKLERLWPEGECPMYLLNTEDLLPITPTLNTDLIEESLFKRHETLYPDGYTRDSVAYDAEDSPDHMVLLSYTSGSTGNPKGVMLPYRSLIANIGCGYQYLGLSAESQTLAILPLAHMFGLLYDLLYPIAVGAHIFIYTQRLVPAKLLTALQDIKPELLMTVPLLIEKIVFNKVKPALEKPLAKTLLRFPLANHAIYHKINKGLCAAFGGNIRQVVLGGAPLNQEVANILQKIKFPFNVGYGMTECGPLITFSHKGETPLGSCGKIVSEMEMKISSDDPINIPGEILVRGTNVMLGYYKNQEATDEVIDADGWMHTGDLGTIDKSGCLYIRGRKKNMLLTSNGQNVFPEEAEGQVLAHTLFDECVVVQREGRLVALVFASDLTLKANNITREQIEEHLDDYCKAANTYLPRYSQIYKFEQRTEEFEKTPKKNIRRFLYK
ncbi:MAG: AMP-binding protein [Prevotellaceae bacterium]|nr:AMP-binding protein [Prevotellaceae bacterium]